MLDEGHTGLEGLHGVCGNIAVIRLAGGLDILLGVGNVLIDLLVSLGKGAAVRILAGVTGRLILSHHGNAEHTFCRCGIVILAEVLGKTEIQECAHKLGYAHVFLNLCFLIIADAFFCKNLLGTCDKEVAVADYRIVVCPDTPHSGVGSGKAISSVIGIIITIPVSVVLYGMITIGHKVGRIHIETTEEALGCSVNTYKEVVAVSSAFHCVFGAQIFVGILFEAAGTESGCAGHQCKSNI